MSSDDYLHAFQNITKLGLKKVQEREILRVLIQCALAEKDYNPFYNLLIAKFTTTDFNMKYTLKYCLWDYLKELQSERLSASKTLRLAQIFGSLAVFGEMPLHFLKVLSFSSEQGEMSQA